MESGDEWENKFTTFVRNTRHAGEREREREKVNNNNLFVINNQKRKEWEESSLRSPAERIFNFFSLKLNYFAFKFLSPLAAERNCFWFVQIVHERFPAAHFCRCANTMVAAAASWAEKATKTIQKVVESCLHFSHGVSNRLSVGVFFVDSVLYISTGNALGQVRISNYG